MFIENLVEKVSLKNQPCNKIVDSLQRKLVCKYLLIPIKEDPLVDILEDDSLGKMDVDKLSNQYKFFVCFSFCLSLLLCLNCFKK